MGMKSAATASLVSAFAAGLFAQGPAFEVASIKVSPPLQSIGAQILSGKLHVGMRIEANRVDIDETPLSGLIQLAYKVKPYQISGPSWMSEQRFDVHATMPQGAVRDQVPQMLQTLLAERFKLTIRRDTKEHPVYALVVGKDGPKMTPAMTPAGEPDAGVTPNLDASKNGFGIDTPDGNRITVSADNKGGAVASSPGTGKIRVSMGADGAMKMETERMTMPALADQLSPMLDRPVFDMTGLKGRYQVTLELTMEELMQSARAQGVQIPMMPGVGRSGAGSGAVPDPSGSSVFQSVQKLGLRLEPRKVPVDLIVVDHLEKVPTEN